MISSILMVCTGNICRSPLAEYRFTQLVGNDDVRIASAGVNALVDQPADQSAVYIAQENGLDLSPHKGQSLTASMIQEYELILVMESHHKKVICNLYPFSTGKVFLLGKWLDDPEIADPYKKSLEMFRAIYEKIDQSCQQWIPYLEGVT